MKDFLYKHKQLIIFVHPIDKVHVSYFDLLHLPIEHFNPKLGLLLNILLIPHLSMNLRTLTKLKTPIIAEKGYFNYEVGWSSIEW